MGDRKKIDPEPGSDIGEAWLHLVTCQAPLSGARSKWGAGAINRNLLAAARMPHLQRTRQISPLGQGLNV